jgi:hypothetical protein
MNLVAVTTPSEIKAVQTTCEDRDFFPMLNDIACKLPMSSSPSRSAPTFVFHEDANP